MASCGSITLIFIFFTFITAANTSFVTVECSAEYVGEYGHNSLLNCAVKTTPEVADAEIRVVSWKKGKKPLLEYIEGEWTQTSGYEFADPSWMKTKNISLLITNTVVSSEGEYFCEVMTDTGDNGKTVNFKVKAKYSEPKIHSIPEKITPNTNSILTCNSEGGYPRGEIRWFDGSGEDWTKSSKMKAIQTDSGLYQLSSSLDLLRGSTFSKYTCVVFNSSGGKEGETTYEIPPPPPLGPDGQGGDEELKQASKIVAPIVVIGSLLVGLLMVLLYRRRSQQARRPSAAPLMGPYVHGGECPYEGCRQEAEEVTDKKFTDSPA